MHEIVQLAVVDSSSGFAFTIVRRTSKGPAPTTVLAYQVLRFSRQEKSNLPAYAAFSCSIIALIPLNRRPRISASEMPNRAEGLTSTCGPDNQSVVRDSTLSEKQRRGAAMGEAHHISDDRRVFPPASAY